jgi:hypothetical protein
MTCFKMESIEKCLLENTRYRHACMQKNLSLLHFVVTFMYKQRVPKMCTPFKKGKKLY